MADADDQKGPEAPHRRTGITNVFQVVTPDDAATAPAAETDGAAGAPSERDLSSRRVMHRRVDDAGQIVVEWTDVVDETPRTGITGVLNMKDDPRRKARQGD